MKKISLFFLIIIAAGFSSALAEDSLKIKRVKETTLLETESHSYPYVLRIGSPIYNYIRNAIRNERDSGGDLSPVEQAILQTEEIEGAGPNSILIFRMKISDQHQDDHTVEIGDLQSSYSAYEQCWNCSSTKVYLLDQGLGLAEILIENGVLYPLLTVGQLAAGPVLEAASALLSPSSQERYINSGLAVLDALKGPVYAIVGIYQEAKKGDVMRSIKSAARVPVSTFFLGATLAVKAVRLPFDLITTAVRETIEFFDSYDANDLTNSGLFPLQAMSGYKYIRKQLDNKNPSIIEALDEARARLREETRNIAETLREEVKAKSIPELKEALSEPNDLIKILATQELVQRSESGEKISWDIIVELTRRLFHPNLTVRAAALCAMVAIEIR